MLENVSSVVAVASAATVNVTTALASFTSVSLATMQDKTALMWTGVDIFDVSVRLRRGKLLFLDEEELELALAHELPEVPAEIAARVLDTAASISYAMPWKDLVDSALEMENSDQRGRFGTLWVGVSLLPSGFYGLSWQISLVNFSFQWANPLWSALECSFRREEEQIIDNLAKVVVLTVALNPAMVAFDPLLFADLVPPIPATWARTFKFATVTLPVLVVRALQWIAAQFRG